MYSYLKLIKLIFVIIIISHILGKIYYCEQKLKGLL